MSYVYKSCFFFVNKSYKHINTVMVMNILFLNKKVINIICYKIQ